MSKVARIEGRMSGGAKISIELSSVSVAACCKITARFSSTILPETQTKEVNDVSQKKQARLAEERGRADPKQERNRENYGNDRGELRQKELCSGSDRFSSNCGEG